MTFKIDEEAIRKLAKLLDDTKLTEIEISQDGTGLRVQRAAGQIVHAAPPVAAAASAAPAQTNAPTASGPGAVKSPMVGTAYMQATPGNPPFIEVGKKINKGDTILIIEAMKVMNPIKSPVSGTVTQINIADGKPVEFDELLVVIE